MLSKYFVPVVSVTYSVILFFVLKVYQSYQINEKLIYPESKTHELAKKNPLLNNPKKKAIAIITGSTAGIGLNIATELYNLGLIVIIASRSEDKCKKAAEEIKAANPKASGELKYHKLDISDFDSVREFVDWYKSQFKYLTYLYNNAGIHYAQGDASRLVTNDPSLTTKQGYDEVFATNYLGHFLLSHLLLPMIEKGRIVHIASGYHFQADGKTLIKRSAHNADLIDAADGIKRDFFHKKRAYSVSKLAQVLHTYELQRKIKEMKREKDVQVVALCPGWVKTNMIPTGFIGRTIFKFAFPAKAAICTPIMAILDDTLEGGNYIANYIMPLTQDKIGQFIFRTVHKLGARDGFTDLIAFFMVLINANSFGYHKQVSSDESYDEKLSKSLYDWSYNSLKSKGYITDK